MQGLTVEGHFGGKRHKVVRGKNCKLSLVRGVEIYVQIFLVQDCFQ